MYIVRLRFAEPLRTFSVCTTAWGKELRIRPTGLRVEGVYSYNSCSYMIGEYNEFYKNYIGLHGVRRRFEFSNPYHKGPP